jgi:hypothetical protein
MKFSIDESKLSAEDKKNPLVITDFGEGTGPLLLMPKSASFAAN